MPLLEVSGLCKHYAGFDLKDVQLSVEKGEILGLIGRNGAGKSTALKSLIRMVRPDAGDVQFFGLPFEGHEAEIKQRIGFLLGGGQNYMHKKLRVITQATKPFYPNWDDGAYKHYMQLFRLDENKTPAQLSAGMQVKYSLTLALSHRAELLILDEPTSGLDPVSREELLDIFLMLTRQGTGILFSTHITEDLEKCADTIAYIREGRLERLCRLEAFLDSWRLLHFDQEPEADMRMHLTGLKREKRGWSALARTQDAQALAWPGEKADLTDIMVHLEGRMEG